ncbi:MAG TPA: hypothetical protein VF176_06675 [Solirubrobacterales bacterium]
MKSTRTRIAVGATIVGLGGLVGLAASADRQKPAQPVAAKPLVRTQVIRRTTRVTRHAHPKVSVGAASAPVASYASASIPAYAAPVTTSSSGATAAPVTTSASGAGGGEGEYEDEAVESGNEHESEGADD